MSTTQAISRRHTTDSANSSNPNVPAGWERNEICKQFGSYIDPQDLLRMLRARFPQVLGDEHFHLDVSGQAAEDVAWQ